ncbi:ornithine cyclodeaminase family protein [Azospirillum doebereinerae]|uniref:ornithine cyclodeaminase family protein n=1 Tax=Azospirillum doebereinerae TaxID=92933 RepID=UPI001EE5E852|nr:ornithine cyclodeaminase family protein [Azospirillum doebereinerae]MCG5241319.1 ornithine cyclodeaminase family protein [Azospirillum doebereinerae]
MRHFTDADVATALNWPALVKSLREGFRRGADSPPRPHYTVPVPDERDATLLLMPAWSSGRYIGLKTVTVFPDNGTRGLAAVGAHYLLMDARNGRVAASFDGAELTARRTAAVSALGSTYLSRTDSSRLLVVGTGQMAPKLAQAHAAVRPIRTVDVWGRNPEKAAALAAALSGAGMNARVAPDLEEAVRNADIVSCATLATEPLIHGEWLEPGMHLDLVGAFTPAMREADDVAVERARVFVDTRAGTLSEAGEIVQAVARGAFDPNAIQGELAELVRGVAAGRRTPDDITLFKSVGCSLADLVAAELCFETALQKSA